jgi:hypothetical protein
MELIMDTLTYKKTDSFLFNNIQQQQILSDQPRELNEYEIDLVSGGFNPAAKMGRLINRHRTRTPSKGNPGAMMGQICRWRWRLL